jgi:hypothetical protein
MARIVYTIGEIFGSIGGLTFQRNRSGKIVRTRPTVGKKSTTPQQNAHIKHTQLLQEYQNLTLEQKQQWDTYAATFPKINKFGQEKTLTGQNWYESINFWRKALALPTLSTPPPHTLPQSPPDFDIEITETQLKLKPTQPHNYTDSPVIVWVSIPTSRATNSINQQRKFALIITEDPGSEINITTEWEAATGLTWQPLTSFPNAQIFVCLESVRTESGITSPMLCKKANTTITPITEESNLYYYSE